MKKVTKDILKQIDNILSGKDRQVAKELWNILSALRGPDKCDDDLKANSTSIIRSVAFPKTEKNENWIGKHEPNIYADFATKKRTKTNIVLKKLDNIHFNRHIEWAATALNLKITWK